MKAQKGGAGDINIALLANDLLRATKTAIVSKF